MSRAGKLRLAEPTELQVSDFLVASEDVFAPVFGAERG